MSQSKNTVSESTILRVAGNILSGCDVHDTDAEDITAAVMLARELAAEVRRQSAELAEPAAQPPAEKD